MQIARHHLQADRSERDEEEWSEYNNQHEFHQLSFEAISASLEQAATDRAGQWRGYSPNACLNCGICANVEISDQYAMTPTLRMTARPIINV